jgi:putative ABC transport system permease protein
MFQLLGILLATVTLVLQGMTPVILGLALGLGGAVALSGFVSTLLYGVPPRDPATFAGVAVSLASIALVACAMPALRATRIDPAITLRAE